MRIHFNWKADPEQRSEALGVGKCQAQRRTAFLVATPFIAVPQPIGRGGRQKPGPRGHS